MGLLDGRKAERYDFNEEVILDEQIFSNSVDISATGLFVHTIKPFKVNASISITIPARGDKEYKFYLGKGATLEYTWSTNDAKLFFDFHGEPEGDTTGYFKSFNKSTENQSSGTLTTSFAGTHGWYWKNNSPIPVTITLKVKGEYQRLDLKKVTDQIKPTQKPSSTTHETIDTL